MMPKIELVRVAKSPDGAVVTLDLAGKMPGRGAYVCRDAACLQRSVKTKGLARTLKTAVPDEILADLTAQLLADE